MINRRKLIKLRRHPIFDRATKLSFQFLAHFFYIQVWIIPLFLISINPSITVAQEAQGSIKNSTVVILSAPDSIKEFLVKYFKFPSEPFSDDTAEEIFLYRAQKEIRSLLATEGYFSPSLSISHQTRDQATVPEITIDPGALAPFPLHFSVKSFGKMKNTAHASSNFAPHGP